MKTKSWLMIILGVLITAVTAMKAQADSSKIFRTLIRPGVNVDVQTDVLDNPTPGPGRTVLMVHGLVHTGNSFRPLANELFCHPPAGGRIKRVLLLNMPGRGGSGLPYGYNAVPYGDLTLQDYTAVLIRALVFYSYNNIAPSAVVAHSMGGLVVQMAQETMLQNGSSLKNLGVNKVTLFGSSSPGNLPDPFLEDGTGLFLLSLYTAQDPNRGNIVSVDPGSFLTFFFTTDLNTSFVPGTPSPNDVVNLGYKADEAYGAALQTLGTADLRPTVRVNAFRNKGTTLKVVFGAVDPFNGLEQQKALYKLLTGDQAYSGVKIINTPDAVHDQHISNPAAVAPALGL